VQRRGQFHNAEPGAEMAAGDGNRIDGFLAEFVGDLPDLIDLELTQVVRGADRVEKRRFTEIGHSDIPILHVGKNVPNRDGLRGIGAAKTQTPDAT
jgi:hypothetical protein